MLRFSMCLMVVLAAVSPSYAEMYFQDDFEDAAHVVGASVASAYPTVGEYWTGSGAIVASGGPTGKYAASVANELWAQVTSASQTATTDAVVTFQLDLLTGSSGYVELDSFTSTGYAGGAFSLAFFGATGSVSEYGNHGGSDTYLTMGTYTPGTVLPVTVTADYGLHTYHAKVGALEFDGVFRVANGSSLRDFHIERGSGGTYGFDNLQIYAGPPVPEPSTMMLLATGLVSLLAYAWRKRK